jgi:hypothetical protein
VGQTGQLPGISCKRCRTPTGNERCGKNRRCIFDRATSQGSCDLGGGTLHSQNLELRVHPLWCVLFNACLGRFPNGAAGTLEGLLPCPDNTPYGSTNPRLTLPFRNVYGLRLYWHLSKETPSLPGLTVVFQRLLARGNALLLVGQNLLLKLSSSPLIPPSLGLPSLAADPVDYLGNQRAALSRHLGELLHGISKCGGVE